MLHAVETLGAQGTQWLNKLLVVYSLPVGSASAHSGSHAETRRVLRGDGDDVFGSGSIDTIDAFQADQTGAVALAEGHRNAVSP